MLEATYKHNNITYNISQLLNNTMNKIKCHFKVLTLLCPQRSLLNIKKTVTLVSDVSLLIH